MRGIDTGQAERLRTVTPHRLFLAVPGRFTAIEPAAVEIHATYSGFADEVSLVQIAPDAKAERPFLPDPCHLDRAVAPRGPRLSERGPL